MVKILWRSPDKDKITFNINLDSARARSERKKINICNVKMMLHGTIGNDAFWRNTVLHQKSSLRIVPCNIILNGDDKENGKTS